MSGLMGLFTLENITKLGLVSIQSLIVEEVFYSLISIESQGAAECRRDIKFYIFATLCYPLRLSRNQT